MQAFRVTLNKFILLTCICMSCKVHALTIVDAYSLALENDPTFQAARKEKEAGNENAAIGRANLLPKLNINYQNGPKNWQKQSYQTSDYLGDVSDVTKKQQYRSYAASITLTQPLFDYEAYAKYKSGIVQSLMADSRYQAKLLDLAVRVVTAYVDVANARDKIELAKAQAATFSEQLILNQKLIDGGEGTVTDEAETEAKYSLSQALIVDANNNLDEAKHKLELIIGGPINDLSDLQELKNTDFVTSNLDPKDFTNWQNKAMTKNPILEESRSEIEAARYEIERNRSGFFPQIQLYASHSANDSNSDNTVNQKYNTNSIGIQLNMNLFDGGGTLASTRQAADKYGQAKYEYDAKANDLIYDLRKQYFICANSPVKIKAYTLAVKAANIQVIATKKSVQAGQRINLDVLNAEQQFYSATNDLQDAKYSYIKAWVSLLNDTGTLDLKNIHTISSYFN